MFVELPKPDEIYDYAKYTNSSWLLNKEEIQEDNTSKTFNLTF